MAKTIVFCADGTWNGPEEQTGKSGVDHTDDAGELTGTELTNVVKLYSYLSGAPTAETKSLHHEQEKTFDVDGRTLQVAKYLHGVGDSNKTVMKVLGGVFGVGVIARIVRGYTFISRHYQPGDAIHIAGFSRGAYTARSLAGMICSVGLLNPTRYDVNDKEEAYERGRAAWFLSKGITLSGNSLVSSLANRVVDFLESSVARLKLKSNDLIPNIPIKSVAVWDTVGSLGIPLYMKDGRLDIFQFTDAKLSDKVERGFHAMAIDEQRADFPVTKWARRAGVEQVWFAGAHADVGGGYIKDESHLSDVALDWMIKKLSGVDVRFASQPSCVQGQCLTQAIHMPWAKPPFKLLAKSRRQPHIEDTFHASVIERWKTDSNYRPSALSFVTSENIDRLTVHA
jgi:uncharacterized protein (DUF2235 family)